MDAPKTSLFLGLPSDYMLEYYNTIQQQQQQQQIQLQQHNNKFINVNINDNSSINSNSNSNISYNNNNHNNNSSNSVCNSISLEYEANDVDNINDIDSNQCIRMSDDDDDADDEHGVNQQQCYTNNCSNDVIIIDGVGNDTSAILNSDNVIDKFHYDDYDNNVSRIEVETMPMATAYQCATSTLYDDSEEMTSVSGSSNNNNNTKKAYNNAFSWHNEEEFAYLDSWRNLGFISSGAAVRRIAGITTRKPTTTTVDSSSSLSSAAKITTATTTTNTNNCFSSTDSTNTSATQDYQSSPVFTVDDYNKIQQKQHENQFNKYQCSLSNYPKQIK